MVYFICVWSFLLAICTLIGTGALSRLGADALPRSGDRWIASLWLGLIGLAIGLLAVSLFWPLSTAVSLLTMISMAGIALLSKSTRIALHQLWQTRLRQRLVILVSLLVGVAAIMNRSVVWLDTGYYHYSSIQWLAQYGSVPGIALLFNNLGFTSSWFAASAPWNPEVIAARSSAIIGGFAGLISLLHCLIAGQRIGHRIAQLSDWFAFIFMGSAVILHLFLKPFSEILVSPSPDLPIFLLVGTISWAILATSQPDRPPQIPIPSIDARAIPLILAAGAVTIKLTALPLLLVSSLYFVATRSFSWRRSTIGLSLVSLILLPYLASSVVTSGCPLYPSNALCFDLPWSPTAKAAAQIASNTHNWVSWYGQPPAGQNAWLWALGQMVKSSAKEGVILGIVGLALASAIYILKTKYSFKPKVPSQKVPSQKVPSQKVPSQKVPSQKVPSQKVPSQSNQAVRAMGGEVWVCAIGILGLVFLMLTSMFFRFLMPYALTLLSLLAAVLFADRQPAQGSRFFSSLRLSIKQIRWGSISLIACVVAVNAYQTAGHSWLLPPAMKADRIVRKETNGIVYSAPMSGDVQQSVQIKQQLQKDMCWAATLPCAYHIAPEVRLRQPQRGIAGGFTRK